jgi:hypothetical protein
MGCVQWLEPSDQSWTDNWLCIPLDSGHSYSFSSAGVIPGGNCLQITEPADPNSWTDNYFCIMNTDESPYSGVDSSVSNIMYGEALYSFYPKGNRIYYLGPTNIGSTKTPRIVPYAMTSDTVNAVVYQDLVYLFYPDRANTGQIWCTTFDGTSWSAEQQLINFINPDEGATLTPSAVVYNGWLYVIFRTIAGHLGYTYYDGTSWLGGYFEVYWESPMDYAPGCATHTDQTTGIYNIYCSYRLTSDGLLYYTYYSTEVGWSVPTRVDSISDTVSASPFLIEFSNQLWLFYRRYSDSSLRYSTYDTTQLLIDDASWVSACCLGVWSSPTATRQLISGSPSVYFYDFPTLIVAGVYMNYPAGGSVSGLLGYWPDGNIPPVPDSSQVIWTEQPQTIINHDPSTYFIITSDPQYPWCEMKPNPTCEDPDGEGGSANKDSDPNSLLSFNLITSQYSSVNRLSNLIVNYMGDTFGGTVINGDLTAKAHPNQRIKYSGDLYTILQGDRWPGLGNHDYQNYVGQCPYNRHYHFTDCEGDMVDLMNSMIAGRVPEFDAYYTPILPRTLYYMTGSLAYITSPVNNYYIIQLQNYPTYTKDWGPYLFDYGDYTITSSMDWLAHNLATVASTNGKAILNMHNYGDNWNADDLISFNNLVNTYSYLICGVFVGHIHQNWGQDGSGHFTTVPLFWTGSSMYSRYSVVEFDPNAHTMSVIGMVNDRNGTNAMPIYWTPGMSQFPGYTDESDHTFGTYPC